MDYKIYRTLAIAILVVDILAFFGITSSVGYALNQPIVSGILVQHVLAIINIYALWVVWKKL